MMKDMAHLLIDGYNLLHYLESQGQLKSARIPFPKELQDKRQILLEQLADYKSRKDVEISIVFDATDRLEFLPRRTRFGNISVLFSADEENADVHISRLCEKDPAAYVVISNDGEVLVWAQQFKCLTMSCREFSPKLQTKALDETDMLFMEEEEDDSRPLYPKVSTRKKGAARKLPKNERRRKNQLRNL